MSEHVPMDRQRRRGRSRVRWVAAAIAVLAASGAWLVAIRAGDQGDPLIARVEGVPILLSQARSRLDGLAAVHADTPTTSPAEWHDRAFESLVDDVVIEQEAARAGVVVGNGDVQRSFERLRDRIEGDGDFRAWLADLGMSENELRRRIRLQLLAARVYERVTQEVRATDEEVADHYATNPSLFETADGEPRPLLEVRESIEELITKEKQDRAFAAWLSQRRDEVTVEVLIEDWGGAR
jgi:hypothetical protein